MRKLLDRREGGRGFGLLFSYCESSDDHPQNSAEELVSFAFTLNVLGKNRIIRDRK